MSDPDPNPAGRMQRTVLLIVLLDLLSPFACCGLLYVVCQATGITW